MKPNAMVLLLTLTMLTSSQIGVVNAGHLKYSELVNLSIDDFAASIANNVSSLVHEIELANEVHDYDTIARSFNLIDQNDTQAFNLAIDFQGAGLWEKQRLLIAATTPIFQDVLNVGTPIYEIAQDARKRVEERNAEIEEREQERIRQEAANYTPVVIPTLGSSIPNKGFGNYTFEGEDDVRVTVRKGTDIVHMMAIEEIPTEIGYTKDSAQYTVTSTGKKIKGYIDYTLDGYVIVMQPRPSLTKGEFMELLDTFRRTD